MTPATWAWGFVCPGSRISAAIPASIRSSRGSSHAEHAFFNTSETRLTTSGVEAPTAFFRVSSERLGCRS